MDGIDRHHTQAVELFGAVLKEFPNYEPAKREMASIK